MTNTTLSKNQSIKIAHNEILDYKDIDVLRKFINDQGKIVSRRSTGLKSKQQKQMTKAIKRARVLALLAFVHKD